MNGIGERGGDRRERGEGSVSMRVICGVVDGVIGVGRVIGVLVDGVKRRVDGSHLLTRMSTYAPLCLLLHTAVFVATSMARSTQRFTSLPSTPYSSSRCSRCCCCIISIIAAVLLVLLLEVAPGPLLLGGLPLLLLLLLDDRLPPVFPPTADPEAPPPPLPDSPSSSSSSSSSPGCVVSP